MQTSEEPEHFAYENLMAQLADRLPETKDFVQLTHFIKAFYATHAGVMERYRMEQQ